MIVIKNVDGKMRVVVEADCMLEIMKAGQLTAGTIGGVVEGGVEGTIVDYFISENVNIDSSVVISNSLIIVEKPCEIRSLKIHNSSVYGYQFECPERGLLPESFPEAVIWYSEIHATDISIIGGQVHYSTVTSSRIELVNSRVSHSDVNRNLLLVNSQVELVTAESTNTSNNRFTITSSQSNKEELIPIQSAICMNGSKLTKAFLAHANVMLNMIRTEAFAIEVKSGAALNFVGCVFRELKFEKCVSLMVVNCWMKNGSVEFVQDMMETSDMHHATWTDLHFNGATDPQGEVFEVSSTYMMGNLKRLPV